MFSSIPILVSSIRGWTHVAEVLDGGPAQAIGDTPSQAVERLERTLKRAAKADELSLFTEWTVAEAFVKKFPVQPVYYREGRRYLAGPVIQFPVRYVRMQDNRSAIYCVLPDLNQQFYCPDESWFTSMLSDTIRAVTATMQPEQLQQYWPPDTSEVRWIRIRMSVGSAQAARPPSVRTLTTVAEPLVTKGSVFVPNAEHLEARQRLINAVRRGSCLVVGEPGCGKSTLLKSVAQELTQARQAERKAAAKAAGSPTPNRIPHFWLSSGGRLIAGMRYLGQWEARLEAALAELADIDGIFVIENLRDLVTLGGSEPRDSIGAFLVPYIRNNQLRIVAEASPAELDVCRRLLPVLVDALTVVLIEPMGRAEEQVLLDHMLTTRARHGQLTYDQKIPGMIQRLCSHYQRHTSPPGPSADFLKSILAMRPKSKLESPANRGPTNPAEQNPQSGKGSAAITKPEPLVVDSDLVVEQFVKLTGLPEVLLRDEWVLKRSEVKQALLADVIGQETACDTVAGIVTRIKSAMNDPQRPFANALLCGPTGVGKTQLAKSLAHYLFGHSDTKTPLIRLDMSEFSGVAAGYRFLQSGDGQPANWIQHIRRRPLSVLLFDEIEKASDEVFDILLSLLDEGRLTDRMGRTTSFRTTVVLMTSNLGGKSSMSIGFGENPTPDYGSAVKKSFRPEFYNRLDHIVPFNSLSPEVVRKITVKELGEIEKREGIVRQRLRLTYSDNLIDHLAKTGFHATLGARPLQRTIETDLIAPLARWLLTQPQLANATLMLDWSSTGLIVNNSINL